MDGIRHANELWERVSLHLVHDPAAMDFYGLLAGAEIEGYLLVGKAAGHQ